MTVVIKKIKMNNLSFKSVIAAILVVFSMHANSQLPLEPGDPAKNANIPDFYKSKLSDVDAELALIKKGSVTTLSLIHI